MIPWDWRLEAGCDIDDTLINDTSRHDYKIDPYYSRYYDPFSSGVDAFTFEWTDNVPFFFLN